MWKYYNSNPSNRQVNDCVIRSISLAENRSWDEVYEELSKLAQLRRTMLDDVGFVDMYLNDKYKHIICRCKLDCETVREFAQSNPVGIFLVTMKGHITCIIDGVIHDTWDCGDKRIWGIWEVV